MASPEPVDPDDDVTIWEEEGGGQYWSAESPPAVAAVMGAAAAGGPAAAETTGGGGGSEEAAAAAAVANCWPSCITSFSLSSSMYRSMLQIKTDLLKHPSWFCLAMCSLWSDKFSILDRWFL